jgi:hypothetical protein
VQYREELISFQGSHRDGDTEINTVTSRLLSVFRIPQCRKQFVRVPEAACRGLRISLGMGQDCKIEMSASLLETGADG